MGEAKKRGSYEQRASFAPPRAPKDLGQVTRRSVRMSGGPGNVKSQVDFVNIPRLHVEHRRPEALLALLDSIASTEDTLVQQVQCVMISFEGYDKDRREVFQIPEIRLFVGEVLRLRPWLLTVLHPDSYVAIFGSVCQIVNVRQVAAGGIRLTFDTPELRNTIELALEGASALLRARVRNPDHHIFLMQKLRTSTAAFLHGTTAKAA